MAILCYAMLCGKLEGTRGKGCSGSGLCPCVWWNCTDSILNYRPSHGLHPGVKLSFFFFFFLTLSSCFNVDNRQPFLQSNFWWLISLTSCFTCIYTYGFFGPPPYELPTVRVILACHLCSLHARYYSRDV